MKWWAVAAAFAVLLVLGLGAGGVAVRRRPSAPRDPLTPDDADVEAELQEMIAEERARQREHARRG